MALGEVAKEGVIRTLVSSDVVIKFHELYYGTNNLTWLNTKWRGVYLAKCPLDLWQYQEIIAEKQPDVIIETGTWHGGSALYLRDMLRIAGKEKAIVITIDTAPMGTFKDEDGVIQLIGNSCSPIIEEAAKKYIVSSDKVMVILDSDHSKPHVLAELNVWGKYVSAGHYLIVEDTNVNGNPIYTDHGPGPMEAMIEWLRGHPEFKTDEHRERFLMTFNPKGYLKRLGGYDGGREYEIGKRIAN